MQPAVIPLEDELGDVVEKALRRAGSSVDDAAAKAGIGASRLRDAIDYRGTLATAELRQLARVLGLNEVGLCALGSDLYPRPQFEPLPFSLWPLRIPHGIGVANAYVVARPGAARGVLFDVGPRLGDLVAAWPPEIEGVDAVFLTHIESEHTGDLCSVVAHFDNCDAFVPGGVQAPCGRAMGEGDTRVYSGISITALSTPGHAAAHNCYIVRLAGPPRRPVRHSSESDGGSPQDEGALLLISGDLLFAGSAGGGYFCHQQLQLHLRRVLEAVPPGTIVAPGHGPMTTAENELRFNPFVL